jgi:hypothetical protein
VEIIDLADQDALDILRSRFCKVRKGDYRNKFSDLKKNYIVYFCKILLFIID